MQTITSLSASAAKPELLSAVVADYMALDQARTYRRLFVGRFGVLAACRVRLSLDAATCVLAGRCIVRGGANVGVDHGAAMRLEARQAAERAASRSHEGGSAPVDVKKS